MPMCISLNFIRLQYTVGCQRSPDQRLSGYKRLSFGCLPGGTTWLVRRILSSFFRDNLSPTLTLL